MHDWGAVSGSWFVVRGSWFVVRGSWFKINWFGITIHSCIREKLKTAPDSCRLMATGLPFMNDEL
jgi:hypothetical protein